MKLLLKQTLIANPGAKHHLKVKDVLISDGIIEDIADELNIPDARLIQLEGLTISPGWIDTFAHFNDPGFEFKETIETGAEAAAAGGFTHVFVIPNTSPVIANKGQVEYIVQKGRDLVAHVLPLGAVTKNAEGKELAEMYDMRNSGAIAFSDGTYPVQTPGLLLKALQYVKAFNGIIIQLPVDQSIGGQGLINEGITSTQLGLPGIPAIAEELMIARDVALAKYTGSRLHISGISTQKSIEMITSAKAEGVHITCSVTPYHLYFCDEDLHDYDTNLKVNSPLRSRNDMLALREAVANAQVDCIATHHLPQDWDNKTCEFEYAKNGMIGLESTFSVFNSLFPDLPVEQLLALFTSKARTIFGLQQVKVEAGEKADLTLFTRGDHFTFARANVKSKSVNSPFIGRQLKGRVIGIINKERVYLND
ncbi:dihydroorotase [Segetibacter sp. 3557_3]|uniref:dihydroorotase n=1 Tax=Segetibacter sp. 3557_3 TaxID=2547429 RepID=UPI001059192A|nr:dihydroorotase [Segetibacter sp. 3557_3]TDH27064.1 dihydroorotase [Segetibacter sp. 3557_3]